MTILGAKGSRKGTIYSIFSSPESFLFCFFYLFSKVRAARSFVNTLARVGFSFFVARFLFSFFYATWINEESYELSLSKILNQWI